MDEKRPSIIYVDDEDINLTVFKHSFKNDFDFVLTKSPLEVEKIIEENDIHVLISDQRMPDLTGLDLIKEVNIKYPDIICIILTAFVDEKTILSAINKGNVYRYVTKPWKKDNFKPIILNALQLYKLKEDNKKLIEQTLKTNIELERHKSQLESIVEEQTKKISKKNKKLNELVATKDMFFSVIAHDLKNHFYIVKNSAELLMLNLNSVTKERQNEIIKLMHEATTNTFSLLENLLIWARSQTGNLKFNIEKTNIKLLIDSNINIFVEIAQQKNIEIINKFNDDIFVFADKDSINTVIRNLISNAIKFTKKGGNIEIGCTIETYGRTSQQENGRTSQQENGRTSQQENGRTSQQENNPSVVEIYVKDNGIGISKENLNKIFRIDTKFTKKGTENESGTGLGLILCKEFVNKNNGDIYVESKVEQGTTFSFTLKKAT